MGVAMLALVIAASGAAVAAIPSSDGTVTACRDNKTGALRVIDAEAGQSCTSRERQLAWKDGITGDQDSTAFGVTTKTNHQETGECDTVLPPEEVYPPTFNECAPVTVTVPPGRQYRVTVFSSFTAHIDPFSDPAERFGPSVWACPAIKGGTYELRCIDQGRGARLGGHQGADVVVVEPQAGSGAYSAGTSALPAGTYTFSTAFLAPTTPLEARDDMRAHTTVLVTDASAPGPPIQ
jgi:hypothetical protein